MERGGIAGACSNVEERRFKRRVQIQNEMGASAPVVVFLRPRYIPNLIVTAPSQPNVLNSAKTWWRNLAAREGKLKATTHLLSELYQFLRDSTPERLRARFGDADYDWEHHVNTTSGAVSARDRLLGVFHSPYQPTEAALFHEMMEALQAQPGFNFTDFTFIDLGSGKGRTILMAADYPFTKAIGVELLPSLDAIAKENLRTYKSESRKCFALESICADATRFPLPATPLVIYLFNPFPNEGLAHTIAGLEKSWRDHPRKIFVLYHNPLLEDVLQHSPQLHRISGTHQYSLYAT